MKKIGLLICSYMLMTSSFSFAADVTCTQVLTCEDLGYVYTATQCKLKPMLRCPMNNSKVYCKLEIPTNCSIGSIYDPGFGGCRLNNVGDFTVIATNKDGGQCIAFLTGQLFLILNKTGAEAMAEAEENCAAMGGLLPKAAEMLLAESNRYTFTDDLVLANQLYLTADAGAVTFNPQGIAKLNISNHTDAYAYTCSVRGPCETETTTSIEPLKLTCRKGAYRTKASVYSGGCLGDPSEAGSNHLIVLDYNGTDVVYVITGEVQTLPEYTLANARAAALRDICGPKGGVVPTSQAIINLYNVLFARGELTSVTSLPGFSSSIGSFITSDGCVNFNIKQVPTSNCGATGGKFAVLCSYSDVPIIE